MRVKIVADRKLREENPRWVDGAARLIEAASDYFAKEFGIRFVAQKIGPWPLAEKSSSTALLLTRLKEEVPLKDQDGSYDLIIGLTGEAVNLYFGGRGRVDRIGDCQQGLGNYVVSSVSAPLRRIGVSPESELDLLALIHELGHIFGAEHTKDINSIMHQDFAYRTELDKKSREVILKNKFCPFGKE